MDRLDQLTGISRQLRESQEQHRVASARSDWAAVDRLNKKINELLAT
jgi:hypothetical protein